MAGGRARAAVCVPLYNKAEFIGATIESALSQTLDDVEVVVLDNASTDGSPDIAASYATDSRVRLHHNDTTIPAFANFRRVVELSTAPLVKILCADDVIVPTCLERQVGILDRDPALALTAGRQDFIDGRGDVLAPGRGLSAPGLLGRHGGPSVLRAIARHGGNPIGSNCSVLFRREAFTATAVAAPFAFNTDDIQTWAAMLTVGDFYGLDGTVAGFRFPDGVRPTALGARWLRTQWRLAASLCRLDPAVGRPDALLGATRVTASWLNHNAQVFLERSRLRGPSPSLL